MGIIRKITIGDLKDGITYKVGQEMLGGSIVIKSILHDVDYLLKNGINKYDILVSPKGETYTRMWKSFENMNISVEYDISIDV